MATNLYQASRQWATRPADERFGSLQELYRATRYHFETSAIAEGVQTRSLMVRETEGDDLVLVGSTGQAAKFTDYSFRQLCGTIGAPAKYLSNMPADIAASCLNHGLSQIPGDAKTNMLFHANGSLIYRGMNGPQYQRIWNYEVAEFCMMLQELDCNWRVPPARPFPNCPAHLIRKATEADVLDLNSNFSLAIRVGDPIAPAGLYASAHDIFVFMVNQDRTLSAGNGEVLNRGFFIIGSEVSGVCTHKIVMFSYEHVCGNHIVWDVKNVIDFSFPHRGKGFRAKVQDAYNEMRKAIDASPLEEEARIRAAKNLLLGESKDKVIDLVFDKGIFTRKEAVAAYETAEQFADVHGDPRTAWGFASGVTRMSQTSSFADRRAELDRAAGKVLNFAF